MLARREQRFDPTPMADTWRLAWFLDPKRTSQSAIGIQTTHALFRRAALQRRGTKVDRNIAHRTTVQLVPQCTMLNDTSWLKP